MRRFAALALCALLASACSSSHPGGQGTTVAQSSTAPPTSATPTTSASASARASASAVPGSAGTSTGTTGATAPTGAPPASTPATGVKGTAPGDYTYDAVGSYAVNGASKPIKAESTLTVSPVKDGRQTSTRHAEQGGDTVQELVLATDGVRLARLTIGMPVNKEFRPATPALLFPKPAVIGRKWSWKATSTDGKDTVSTTNQVLRTETITIGGQRVDTVVLHSRLVVSGEIDYTADVTSWVATDYQLPVKDHTKGSGNAGGFAFTTDITSTLRSVHPS